MTVLHPNFIDDDQYTGEELVYNLVECRHKRVPIVSAQLDVGEFKSYSA